MWWRAAPALVPTARPTASRPRARFAAQQLGPVMWRRAAPALVPTARPTASRPRAWCVDQRWGPVTWPRPASAPAPAVQRTVSSPTARPVMTVTLQPATTSAQLGPVQARPAEGEASYTDAGLNNGTPRGLRRASAARSTVVVPYPFIFFTSSVSSGTALNRSATRP